MPESGDSGAPPAEAPQRDEPVVPRGGHFEGLVVLSGEARVEGSVRGEIVGADRLWIGPEAELEARVEAGELVVAGRVAGRLRAERSLTLEGTARVRGDVETPRLTLAEGARLDGRCRIPRRDGAP